ncbi:unnamed protein product [Schistosoma bovis]|nr:unnamed protein product [Schistosoma bovis]
MSKHQTIKNKYDLIEQLISSSTNETNNGNLKLISKVAPRNTSKSDYYQTLSTRSAIVITLTNEKKHNNLLSESLQ